MKWAGRFLIILNYIKKVSFRRMLFYKKFKLVFNVYLKETLRLVKHKNVYSVDILVLFH